MLPTKFLRPTVRRIFQASVPFFLCDVSPPFVIMLYRALGHQRKDTFWGTYLCFALLLTFLQIVYSLCTDPRREQHNKCKYGYRLEHEFRTSVKSDCCSTTVCCSYEYRHGFLCLCQTNHSIGTCGKISLLFVVIIIAVLLCFVRAAPSYCDPNYSTPPAERLR